MPPKQKLKCRECQAVFLVGEKYFGKRIPCPKCEAMISVPNGRREHSPANAPGEDFESEGDPETPLPRRPPRKSKRSSKQESKEGRTRNRKGGGKRSKKNTTFASSIASIFHEYEALLRPIGFVCLFLAVCGIVVGMIGKGSQPSVPGRPQKEFGNRTTTKWIELEREGKARHVEVLWQDQRWIPLDQYLGLDWAAVPEWFNALTDGSTKMLAEQILGKYTQTTGTPYLDDLQAGMEHENPLIRTWAARLTSKLEGDARKDVLPLLETLTKDSDANVSEAAQKSLDLLGNTAG